MCDVLSERGDECCAVTLRILVFKLTFDVHTIASASSGASMDARYHLGASGIFCGLLDRPIVRVNLEILVLVVRQPQPQPQHRPEMS